MRIVIPLTILTGLLAGCASLSEDECHIGNWEAIGRNDATEGRTTNRFNDHIKACHRYGVLPDKALYDAGYEAGLVRYCTPSNGFNVGRNGYEYRSICPPVSEAEFLRGYERGRDLHAIEKTIAEAKNNLAEVRVTIGEVRASEDKDKKKTLRRLRRDVDRLEDELYRLNIQRDRALLEADRFLAVVSPDI